MKFRVFQSLTTKLILQVVGGTVLVFGMVLGYIFFASQDVIHRQIEENARHLTDSMVRRIEQEFRAIAKIPESMAFVLEVRGFDQTSLNQLISRFVNDNEEVYGSTVAFEPYAFQPDRRAYSPYYYMTESGPQFAQLGDEDYDYFDWDWYRLPRETQAPLWTEPYFDEGGGEILMCTYSVPFFQIGSSESDLRGIVTGDLSLEWMSDLITEVRTGETGFGFLISASGQFVAHPDHHLIMTESIFTVAEQLDDESLTQLGESMTTRSSGLVSLDSGFTDGEALVSFAQIPSTGWSLGVVFHRDELLAEFHRFNRFARHMAVLGAVLLCLVVALIARAITGPLRRMAKVTQCVAEGDLDVDLSDVRSRDEVGRLARAFSRMSGDLKKYIADLTETTAAKERIESELDIATHIQRSVLPCTFPAFPERDEFQIHAVMEPAREVGGDFYDFFFVDDDQIALVIGDVSGKGVPAALFMMVSRTLVNAISQRGKTPAQVLADTNDRLCEGNDESMFVTLFLAYYNVKTGRLTYANAGHNPALIIAPDGSQRSFGRIGGTALGCFPELSYQQGEDELKPGEILALSTDGIIEAHSPKDECYEEDRFVEFLIEHRNRPLADISQAVVETVLDYQAGHQFDDITLLLLRRTVQEA